MIGPIKPSLLITLAILLVSAPRVEAQGMENLASASAAAAVRIDRDTIFVLDSSFIEIDLGRQELYRHLRGGLVDTFLCSTGNPKLPRAIATRKGIFAINWKAARHVSTRFNVPMLYWMPFNGGIGIHALEDESYYAFLGDQPSSHGCVRVSKETGESLFHNTPVGTVVLVHDGSPARIVRFAEQGRGDIEVMKRIDSKLLRERLEAITSGRSDDPSLRRKLALPEGKKPVIAIGVGSLKGE